MRNKNSIFLKFIKIYLCITDINHESLQHQKFPENIGQLTQKRHHENPLSNDGFDGHLFLRNSIFGN